MRFKNHEIAKITGIPIRRILDWVQRDYLIPAEPAEGQGRRSFYDEKNIAQIKILEKLFTNNISPKTLCHRFGKELQNININEDFCIEKDGLKIIIDKKVWSS